MAFRQRRGRNLIRLAMIPGRRSMLLKTLLIYISIGSLLTALLSLILYERFSSLSIQQMDQVSMDSLKQSMNTFDQLWNSLYLNMNKEFQSNSTVLEGMALSAYDPVESSKIGAALNDIVNSSNMIDSVCLYNSDADLVFSNYGTAVNSEKFYDAGLVDLIRKRRISISQISGCAVLYRKMHYVYGSMNVTKNVITVAFSSDDMKTALIYNIDQGILQNLLVPENSPRDQSLLILNRDGVVISDSDPQKIFSKPDNQDYIRKILASRDLQGSFPDTVEGSKSLVTFVSWNKWNTLGWIFVKTAGFQGMFGPIRTLQASVLAITLLFILAAAVVGFLSWGNLFRPFYRLIENLRSRSPFEPAKMNEIEYLGDVYGSLVRDIDTLNSFQSSSRPLLRQEYLHRILNGDIAQYADASSQASSLGLRLDAEKYQVVVFRLDRGQDGAEQDTALLRYTACGVVAQVFAAVEAEAVESGEDNLCVILGAPPETSELLPLMHKAQEACAKALRLSFTVGIGTVENGIEGISLSYRTAMEATAYRLVYGCGSVIEYTSEAVSRQKKYIYPLEAEKKLLDAAKATDFERFSEALTEFMGSVEGYTLSEIMLALSQLSIILVRTLKAQLEVTHMQEAGIHADLWEVDSAIRSSETLRDIQQWLLIYFQKCMDVIRNRRFSKYNEIIESVCRYAEGNFGNPDLTVDIIASVVKLSPNYLRSLFKDHMGMTLSHYLNDLRFRKAKELLADTDYPITRIAQMVGFPESSYFFSAFKNTVGMTPAEFRKGAR